MKKLLLVIAFCISITPIFAQEDAGKVAVNKFLASFNEQQFDEIYDSFTPSFQQQVPRAGGTGLLTQVFAMTGKLVQAEQVAATGGGYVYLLHGEKSNISLSFSVTGSKFNSVLIKPADAPPTAVSKRAPLKTNNPTLTVLDKALDKKINEFLQGNQAPGLSVAVLSNGVASYYGYGETAKGNTILPGSTTLYDIGSVTKTFTAYILASLINEKKITLDKKLNTFFTNLDEKVGAITIGQLANHTSGLPNMGTIPTNGDAGRDPNEKYTAKDLASGLTTIQLVSVPGETFNYSNLGFATLGAILEKVSGQTYSQLLDKYILRPNKMTQTFYKKPIAYPSITKGYDEAGIERDYLNLDAYGPAGNIKSTAEDLMKYAQLMMSGDKAAVLARTITYAPEKGNKIGLSWIVIPMGNTAFYFHNGATIGYRSYIAIEPISGKALVILNNSAFDVTNLGMQMMQDVLAN